MNELYTALSLSAIITSSITAIFSILAYCKVVGLENSTHRIEYMPAPMPQNLPEDQLDGMSAEELAKGFNPKEDEEGYLL